MSLHEVVIREIERDRSFKVFKLFAESSCRQSRAEGTQEISQRRSLW